MQAVINVAIAPLTTNPALWAQNPQQSRLVDELLLGMPAEITGEAEQLSLIHISLPALMNPPRTSCALAATM